MGLAAMLFASACGAETNDAGVPPDEQSEQGELVQDGCKLAGCSNQLCINAEDDVFTTCEWREEYACYGNAECAQQSNGQCNWVFTPELVDCLNTAQYGAEGASSKE